MTTIILEAASNHEGSLDRALQMVRTAAEVGADMVKFQSYRAEKLRADVPEAERARRAKFQLSDDAHRRLIEECEKCKIPFLTTCFDRERVPFLKSLGLKSIKIASPDCGAKAMLEDLAQFIDTFYISTGMSYAAEIDQAISTLKGKKVVLLHCVSLYPTVPEDIHLKRIDWLKARHPHVGFSDHTLGTEVAKIALARGIEVLEKHWTIDKSLPDFGHTFSITTDEAKEIIAFRNLIRVADGQPYGDLQDKEKAARDKFVGIWGNNR